MLPRIVDTFTLCLCLLGGVAGVVGSALCVLLQVGSGLGSLSCTSTDCALDCLRDLLCGLDYALEDSLSGRLVDLYAIMRCGDDDERGRRDSTRVRLEIKLYLRVHAQTRQSP